MKFKFTIIVVAVLAVFTGCGGVPEYPTNGPAATGTTTNPTAPGIVQTEKTYPESEETLPLGVITPSQVEDSLIDSFVKVKGKITLVHQDPSGLALWLSDDKSKVGIRIEQKVWDGMSAEEQAQYEKGKTVIAEGMLVLAPSQELFVVVGVEPPPDGASGPLLADVEIVSGPVNLSKQPTGSRGWPWPKIFLRDNKIVVTYRGEVNGRESQWLIENYGNAWSPPRELPPGEVIISNKGAYTLSAWKYTDREDEGIVGVVLNVLDDNYAKVKSITVDTRTCLHSIDRSTFPVGAIDNQGNFHIVWVADTEIGTDIFYSRYDGAELTEPVAVSKNPEKGSINHNIAVDDYGVVYVSWSETPEAWDPETEGGYPDDFYAYLGNSVWSEPKNISNTPDWGEYGMALFTGGQDVHTFYIPSRMTEPGQMRYVVLRKDEILREEIVNFSFTDISMIFDGDKIHAVHGGWVYKDAYEGPDKKLALEGKVYYTCFEGENWYAGMGAELLPQEFLDNSEKPVLVGETTGPGYQDRIILGNGETDSYREIRPETVYKDGLFYTVFEHIQNDTADAYLVVFRPNNP